MNIIVTAIFVRRTTLSDNWETLSLDKAENDGLLAMPEWMRANLRRVCCRMAPFTLL